MLNRALAICVLGMSCCVSQSDFDAAKREANDLKLKLAEVQSRLDAINGKLADAENRVSSCEGRVANLQAALDDTKPMPIAEALAAYTRPETKLKLGPGGNGETMMIYECAAPGLVDCSYVQTKANPRAWHFGINGKISAADFAPRSGLKKLCNSPEVFKIEKGPLSGWYIEDQHQQQAIIGNEAYVQQGGFGCIRR